MITTNQFKIGMTIESENTLYLILDFQHVKPGKGPAFVRSKLKNLENGAITDKTWRAGEKVKQAVLDHRKMQYLYSDGNNYVFMDNSTYEQLTLLADQVGEANKYLKEGTDVEVSLHEGKPVSIELPAHVELKVTQTEPGVKGDTVTSGNKPAILETDLKIQVPLFVEVGDVIRVDTRTRKYVTRV